MTYLLTSGARGGPSCCQKGISVNGLWLFPSVRGSENSRFVSRLPELFRCSVSAEQTKSPNSVLSVLTAKQKVKHAGRWAEGASTTASGITSMCQTMKMWPVRSSTRRVCSEWETGSAVRLVAVKSGVLYLVSFPRRRNPVAPPKPESIQIVGWQVLHWNLWPWRERQQVCFICELNIRWNEGNTFKQ